MRNPVADGAAVSCAEAGYAVLLVVREGVAGILVEPHIADGLGVGGQLAACAGEDNPCTRGSNADDAAARAITGTLHAAAFVTLRRDISRGRCYSSVLRVLEQPKVFRSGRQREVPASRGGVAFATVTPSRLTPLCACGRPAAGSRRDRGEVWSCPCGSQRRFCRASGSPSGTLSCSPTPAA